MSNNQLYLRDWDFLSLNPYLKLLGKDKLRLALDKKGYRINDADQLNAYFDQQELNPNYKKPAKLLSYKIKPRHTLSN